MQKSSLQGTAWPCVMVNRERRGQHGYFAGEERNGFLGGLTSIGDVERYFGDPVSGCWLSFYY